MTVLGNGVTLHWDSNGGTTWAQLSRLTDLDPPEQGRTLSEVTCLDSTREEFVHGIKMTGELKVTVEDDDATIHDAMVAASFAKNTSSFKITEPQSSPKTHVFDAKIEKVRRRKYGNKEALATEFTARLAGDITVT